MDVTPRELRDIEIREGFRGYNRDDVDEILERAAATIEGLQERLRQLTERVVDLEGRGDRARETEDMLHRTLLLAQRAADDAVAQAQARARQIVEEAEARARATLNDAEAGARRQAESERQRLEHEVLDLGARREALAADIDELERFETEYRTRLRRAIEGELETLATRPLVAPSPRPTLHDVEMPTPAPRAPVAPSPVSAPAGPPGSGTVEGGAGVGDRLGPAASALAGASVERPAPSEPRAGEPGAPPPTTVRPPDVPPLVSAPERPAPGPPRDPAPPGPPGGEAAAPAPEMPPGGDAGGGDARQPTVLDDDAFFASLREAVTDETPLGPRDEGAEEPDGEEESRSGFFRRRR